MKKKFIVGMMIVTGGISFNAQAAGLGGAKPVREILTDYVKDIQKYAADKVAVANKTQSGQKLKTDDILMDDLKLSSGDKTSIKAVIAGAKDKTAITKSLATILAAKNLAAGKSDAESGSINGAADASLKLMANAPLIGEKSSSTFLSAVELKDTSEALKKLVAMPEKFIAFETKERDSYTKIIEKSDEMSVKAETFEEAFVKAVMESQGVSKEKAMEIVRRLKDCV
jgi:hypothetical protein